MRNRYPGQIFCLNGPDAGKLISYIPETVFDFVRTEEKEFKLGEVLECESIKIFHYRVIFFQDSFEFMRCGITGEMDTFRLEYVAEMFWLKGKYYKPPEILNFELDWRFNFLLPEDFKA